MLRGGVRDSHLAAMNRQSERCGTVVIGEAAGRPDGGSLLRGRRPLRDHSGAVFVAVLGVVLIDPATTGE